MSGNFCLRNSFIFPFRNKISPFLSKAFIDNSFSLNPNFYSNSNLHRRIIQKSNKVLLKYFDNPYKSSVHVQDWENRIHEIDFWSIYEPYILSTTQLLNILDFTELKKLIEKDRQSFSRSFYLYARLGSLILFLNRQEELCNQYLGNEIL